MFLLVVLALYFIALLVLGWRGYRQRRSGSLSDFYLAGNNLGIIVLLSTLYATQYSGNTFLGYTSQAYRIGFAWIMSVGMMMSIVVVYLSFAPALHVLAHRYGFVTPGDWVQHRFGDRRLTLLVSLIMGLSLLNYLYAQFLAMGHIVVSMSDGQLPFWTGVVAFALIIGTYETLGGMRSVAWTDVVQGAMLLIGLLVVLLVAWPKVESLGTVTQDLLRSSPKLVAVPSWVQCGTWISSIALLGLGGAVYPQAIQRIYAARDASTLKRSLRVMVCMPLATTLVVFLVGIAAHAVLPAQSGIATDRIMPEFLAAMSQSSVIARIAAALVLAGALAAIMSTADSALLTLSSIVACDVVGAGRRRELHEAGVARFGKWISWVIIALLVVLALRPPTTLWRLIEIKMELLMQAAPIVIFGIRSPHLRTNTALLAAGVGATLALAAFLLGIDRIGGIHAGTYACAINATICWLGIRRARTSAPSFAVAPAGAGDVSTPGR